MRRDRVLVDVLAKSFVYRAGLCWLLREAVVHLPSRNRRAFTRGRSGFGRLIGDGRFWL